MQDGVEQDGVEQTDVFGMPIAAPAEAAPVAKKKTTRAKKVAAPVEDAAEAAAGIEPVPAAADVPEEAPAVIEAAPVAEVTAPAAAPLAFDLAAALTELGWSAESASVRDLAALAVRGTPAALLTSHAPAQAGPLVAGLVARLAAAPGRRALVLCPAGEESVWAGLAAVAAGTSGVRTAAAVGPARAQRRLKEADLDLLVASPDTALLLHRRAALKPESFDTVLLAWPRHLETGGEALELLLADMKDATRLVVADDAATAAAFLERYARKAVRVGFPADDAEPIAPVAARTVTVSWERRVAAVADVLELLDPTVATVWTADRTLDGALAQVLAAGDRRLYRAVGERAAVQGMVICVDAPTAATLAEWKAHDLVLLAPATTEAWITGTVQPRRPLRLPGALEQATTQAAAERAVIAKQLEVLEPTAALLTLAPLFERHDPALVAAALLSLWTNARNAAPAAAAATPVPAPVPDASATGKIFVGIGKRDMATVADLVAVLTKECRVEKTKIGRIELKDSFMLVEVPAMEAERIASALNGTSIRRKRVTARVDRGPVARGPRPEGGFAPRGPRPDGGFAPRGPRPEGGFSPRGPRPEGGFAPRGPRPDTRFGGGRPPRDRE